MSNNIANSVIVKHVEDNLSPKEEERNLISDRYIELSELLKGGSFQSGSYARFTAITPVNDLDVIWPIPQAILERTFGKYREVKAAIDPAELDVANIIHDLAERLAEEYKKIGKKPRIKAQTHSIGIFFGATDDEFSIDLVPAIPTWHINEYGDEIYLVPEIARLSKLRRLAVYEKNEPINWIKSDPRGYIEDAKSLNDANDNFRKVTKYIKTWKSSCKTIDENFPLKAFNLELIVGDLFKKNLSSDCLAGIDYFYENLSAYLKPRFVDRADESKLVDSYLADLTDAQKKCIAEHHEKAKEILQEIHQATNEGTVINLINKMLGGECIENEKNESRKKTVAAFSRPYYRNEFNR